MKKANSKQIKKAKELANARQYPKFYYARHMFAGLCGYDDDVLLIDTDVMKAMAPTFNGKPVYVLHDERSSDERLATLKETSHGYVTETFYNEVDGWLWSKIMIVDDEGHEAVAAGWSVSNAYIPLEYGEGGTKHNCEYDKKVLAAEFTHLALVSNPRYEDACVMTPDEFKIYQEKEREQLNEIQNSKNTKGYKMKILNRKSKKQSKDEGIFVEMTNAKGEVVEVSMDDMVSMIEQKQKEDEVMNAKVTVNGKQMTRAAVIKAYQEIINAECEKENEDDEELENEDEDELENMEDEDVQNEDDEDELENEDDELENEDDEDEKSNSKARAKKKNHYKELKNAPQKRKAVIVFDSPQNKLDRGKSRYGTAS